MGGGCGKAWACLQLSWGLPGPVLGVEVGHMLEFDPDKMAVKTVGKAGAGGGSRPTTTKWVV